IFINMADIAKTRHPGHCNRFSKILASSSARDQPSDRDAIAANIQNATTTQCVLEQTALRIKLSMESKGSLNDAHLTDGTRTYQFKQPGGLRMATIHKRFHQENIIAMSSLNDSHCFGLIERKRLLTQHMLTSLSGFDSPLGVQRVWNRNIDGLHIFIGQQRLIAAITTRNIPGLAELIGSFLRAATDSQQGSCLRTGHPLSENAGNPSRTN